jgi:hypothetical protein
MDSSGTLSTWELVRRVTDIEMRLEKGLINSSERQNRPTIIDTVNSTVPSGSSEPVVQKITQIFAGGALVDLQVIASGPHPGVPEIKQMLASYGTCIRIS